MLYAGRDTLVWNLLDQVPFVKAERIVIGPEALPPEDPTRIRTGPLRCDAVVIDEQPGDAHPLQVLKSVKAQASDLPVVVLTSTGDRRRFPTAALELGADDTVVKSGIFRRRLIATLRRIHQRLDHEHAAGRDPGPRGQTAPDRRVRCPHRHHGDRRRRHDSRDECDGA